MALFPTVYIAYASHISLLHLRSASITLPLRRSRILSLYPRLLITANHIDHPTVQRSSSSTIPESTPSTTKLITRLSRQDPHKPHLPPTHLFLLHPEPTLHLFGPGLVNFLVGRAAVDNSHI